MMNNYRTEKPPGSSNLDAASIREKLSKDMANHGLHVPSPVIDGKFHRFKNGDSKKPNGWYIIFADEYPAGSFGEWGKIPKINWSLKSTKEMTPEERTAYHARIKVLQEEHDRRQAERWAKGAAESVKEWNAAVDVVDHPYLKLKQVDSIGLRQDKEVRLLIPVYGADENLQSLQRISTDGTKRCLTDGKMSGGWYCIDGDPNKIAICEGYATGASIHQATGHTVYVGFNAGNLLSVAKIVKARHPGAQIVICCDNDKWKPEKGNPGLTKGREAADAIGAIATAPIFKDESTEPKDYNDLAALEGPAEVKRQIEKATAESIENDPIQAPEAWDDPIPLNCELLPVMTFNPEWLPEPLRDWVKDIAYRMQSPIDYPAIGAMVAYSAIAGKRLSIHPKRYDDWVIVPNLWGCVIGRPSAKKTPALQEVLKPLYRLEYDAKDEYEVQKKEWIREQTLQELKNDDAKKNAAKAVKAGDTEGAKKFLSSIGNADESEPSRKRYVVNDATIEKLGELLAENPNGLLLFRDELYGFLKTINREDRANDKAFHLECWTGLGSYTYDRIGRGTVDIKNCIESILGCLTPSKIIPMVSMAITGGLDDDGFIQRFQLMVYPDNVQFQYVDEVPDKDARDTAYAFFKYVSGLTFEPGEYEKIPSVHFSKEAQSVFSEWLTALEMEISSDDIHPAIESHLAKYRSLIPSLALLIHIGSYDDLSGDIQLDSLEKAIAWGLYLKSHALRVYNLAINNSAHLGKLLLDKIKSGKLNNPFVIRDVKRAQWHGLTSEGSVESALKILVEFGYLKIKHTPTGVKPKIEYLVNPKIKS